MGSRELIHVLAPLVVDSLSPAVVKAPLLRDHLLK
jgi:hypothetical protein